MIVVLRILDGTKLFDFNAASFSKFSIGSQYDADYVCEGADPDRKDITFSCDNGQWNLKSGETKKTVTFGKLVFISRKNRQAAMLFAVNQSFHAAADLRDGCITIGRNSDCTICISDETVSRHHARVEMQNDECRIIDENSTSGTYVNGHLIESEILHVGDMIVIGKQYFTYDGSRIMTYLPDYITAAGEVSIRPTFKRSPRLRFDLPEKKEKLELPPTIGSKPEINWLTVLLPPLIMIAASLLLMAISVFMIVMPVIGVITGVINYASQNKKFKDRQKLQLQKYTDYLDSIEKDMQGYRKRQLSAMEYTNPTIAQCLEFARKTDPRLWERRPEDDDFMQLRIGTGTVLSNFQAEVPDQKLSLTTDSLIEQAKQLARNNAEISNAPITCRFADGLPVGIIGERKNTIQQLKNIVVEAATLHAYDELKIVSFFPKEERNEWAWMRWLPHTFSDDRQIRFLADNRSDSAELNKYLEEVFSRRKAELSDGSSYTISTPFYLIIVADMSLVEHMTMMKFLNDCDKDMQVGVVYLAGGMRMLPKECGTILELRDSEAYCYQKDNAFNKRQYVVEKVSENTFDEFARALAPVRLDKAMKASSLPNSVSFLEGYGVKRPEQLGVKANWENARTYQSLAVPVGIRQSGEPFYFDIHEKAHGVNGVVAGMPGSGKTEMAQSWLLSLSLRFAPDDVSFILIDFKGSSLISPFRKSPHLAGSISDLDTKTTRNLIALRSEIERREKLLDQYSHVISKPEINSFNKAYYEGRVPEKLPVLIVVIDEYAQFKKAFPDFGAEIDGLTSKGRALGIFAVLMTQKPAGVVTPATEGNVKFRWCLRVANSGDSKDMIGHSDAARITNPGRAYIKVGEDEVYEEIQSLWSGAPYRPYAKNSLLKSVPISTIDLMGRRYSYADDTTTTGFRASKAEVDAVVEYLDRYVTENNIPRAKRIWTDKLPERIALGDLLRSGFDGQKWSNTEDELVPAIGLVDDPHNQSQYPLCLNLGGDGHAVIYGAPGSGKTTLLHTLIMSLAITYSPDQVNIYGMDFGGWSLDLFEKIPHVGGIANDSDEEKIEKLAGLLSDQLEYRKQLFSKTHANSVQSYREISGENLPYIVLIVDNFAPVLQRYPDLESFFIRITQEGGRYGVLLVATANSTNAVSYKLKSNIKTMLALQMTDKGAYSEIVGKTSGLEPDGVDGRGLVKLERVMEFQTATPGKGSTQREITASVSQLCNLMDDAWCGQRPLPIPVMPDNIPFDSVTATGITLGLTTRDIMPVGIDLDRTHSLMISGTLHSGKSNLLKVIAKQLSRQETKLIVFAPKDDESDRWHDIDAQRCITGDEMDGCLAALVPELQRRKEARDAGESCNFDRTAIVIDDWNLCFERLSDQSVRRIEMIARLGKGLGIYLLIACDGKELSQLYSQGETATNAVVNMGQSILLGGSFQTHAIFDSDLPYSERSAALGEHEGYFLRDGKTIRFKSMYER